MGIIIPQKVRSFADKRDYQTIKVAEKRNQKNDKGSRKTEMHFALQEVQEKQEFVCTLWLQQYLIRFSYDIPPLWYSKTTSNFKNAFHSEWPFYIKLFLVHVLYTWQALLVVSFYPDGNCLRINNFDKCGKKKYSVNSTKKIRL